MKKSIRILLIALAVLIAAAVIGLCSLSVPEPVTRNVAEGMIPDEMLRSYWQNIDFTRAVMLDDDGIVLVASGGREEPYAYGEAVPAGESLKVRFRAPAGDYRVAVSYRVEDDKLLDNLITVICDETEFTTILPALWKDEQGGIPHDRYGNEISPSQERVTETFDAYLTDKAALSSSAVTIHHDGGELTFSLTMQAQATAFERIALIPDEELPAYYEYMASHEDKRDASSLVTVEGEQMRVKSDSFIRAKNTKNASLTPYSTYQKVLNVLDENSVYKSGQKALWEFEVPESGLYTLAFKYVQGANGNMPCFRKIEIDGSVPYKELESVAFPYRFGTGYHNLVPVDAQGNALKVYLEKGVHTISVEVNGEAYDAVYNEIKDIMEDINDLAMSIKKLIGNNTDANRTWDVEDYLPDVCAQLEDMEKRAGGIYEELGEIAGKEPTFANNLHYAQTNLRKLREKPSTLPNRLNLLSEGTGSTAQSFGDLLPVLESQPVGFDELYLAGDIGALPEADAGFFVNLWEGVKSFFYSFSSDMSSSNYSVSGKTAGDELQVWVNRPVQYLEIMQQMVDTRFTAQTGIKVNFSVMPNEQKLILSNASKTNPDVALGIAYTTPYDFAIRGGAKNLLEYDGFLEWYNEEFNLESVVPMCYNHGVYGVSETQDFLVLIYRKDILEKLGLSVPDTWEDAADMMPTLLRYGMNFNIPASNMVTFKNFQGTSPFIYQAGGAFYSVSGDRTAINTASSYNGMQEMTELYQITSLQQYIASFFNSFRYGQVPIGVSGFSTYIQIEMAAPELAGKWDIAPAPGTMGEDGVVRRYQMADGTAGMIFNNTEHPQEAYEFLKWWMSKDTQVEFAYSLQSRFGPEFRWNTANVKAFEELPYPKEHKDIILEQWRWQKEVARHPASYMVEREASNVWNNVVVMGRMLRTELDKAAIISNREISRKLNEFGYMDENGNLIQDYPMDNLEYLTELLGKEGTDGAQ